MPRSQNSKPKPTLLPAKIQNPMSSVGAYTPPPPSFGQVVKEGFAFGTGSAIAHRIFGAATNAILPSSSSTTPGALCDKERLAFETCMKTKSADDFCGSEQTAYTQCIRLEKS
jgi:hypothetical protein